MLSELTEFHNSLTWPVRAHGLELELLSAGRETRRNHDYLWDGTRRGQEYAAILQWTLDGEGELLLKERRIPVKTGQAMLIHLPHQHVYSLPKHSPMWSFVYINLRGSALHQHWREIERRLGHVADIPFESRVGQTLCDIIRLMHAKEVHTRYHASSLAYQCLMELLAHGAASASASAHPVWLSDVLDFARSPAGEMADVQALAATAGMSRFHFSRRFKEHMQITPAAYLRAQRLNVAANLLRDSRLTAADIGRACHFEDPSVFNRAFRAHFGVNPGEYRRRGL